MDYRNQGNVSWISFAEDDDEFDMWVFKNIPKAQALLNIRHKNQKIRSLCEKIIKGENYK